MNQFRCKACGKLFDTVPKACICGNNNIAFWDIIPDDEPAQTDDPFFRNAAPQAADAGDRINASERHTDAGDRVNTAERYADPTARFDGAQPPAQPSAQPPAGDAQPAPVRSDTVPAHDTEKKPSGITQNKNTRILIAALIALVLIGGGILGFLIYRSHNDPADNGGSGSSKKRESTTVAEEETTRAQASDIRLPDFSGTSFSAAVSVLDAYHIAYEKIEVENDGSHTPGTIRDSLPAAGNNIKDGDTVRLFVWASPNGTPAPDDTATQPAPDDPVTHPVDDAPAEDVSGAPVEDVTEDAPPASGIFKPSTKNEILDFYKAAVDNVKHGAAGYTKREWQVLENTNITGNGTVDGTVKKLFQNYMTTAEQVQDRVYDKGTQEARDQFPGFTLTDYSKVKSVKIQENATAYKIIIVMQDEDTPHRGSSFIAQVTNSVLLWEDIDAELKNISVLSEYSDIHVWYRDFTITAVTTKDGAFTALQHLAPNIDIQIGHAKMIINIDNKNIKLTNYCNYLDFRY